MILRLKELHYETPTGRSIQCRGSTRGGKDTWIVWEGPGAKSFSYDDVKDAARHMASLAEPYDIPTSSRRILVAHFLRLLQELCHE